jgi:DNA-directed RNA polymerase specialized sigma24 family protein
VALSAFDSFYRGVEQGRFPNMADRDNLWKLLMVITARKAWKLKRDQSRQKRGGLRTDQDDVPKLDDAALDEVIGREPTPEFAAQVAEECQRLLDGLTDDTARAIALCKMEGYTNAEIAQKLECVPRTVERKLRLIRDTWERESQG